MFIVLHHKSVFLNLKHSRILLFQVSFYPHPPLII